ncbi:hypothetical protein TRAPUB_10843 [Trametes pubescens]|uniref:Uncharacterized protein n=1 Tax=Trametes pubescens TaxID=154538 RepID=A0A1M2VYK2_TRAPU|nr:hypothetical protein TRAPUB_10843 [Trametes pubescens]
MATRYCSSPLLTISTRPLAAQAPRSRACPRRHYAQVGSTTFLGEPPSPPSPPPPSPSKNTGTSTNPPTSASGSRAPQHPPIKPFDAHVLAELRKATSASTSASPRPPLTPLTELVEQYMKRAGHVLPSALPYESRPGPERRAQFSDVGVEGSAAVCSADGALVTIVHVVQDRTGRGHKVAYSSGFAVHAPGAPAGEAVLVTCAHTLEEIRHDPLLRAGLPSPAVRPGDHVSGCFAISGPPTAPVFHPVRAVLSAMHRGDLLLLSASTDSPSSPSSAQPSGLRTLPVNPYPVQPGTTVRAHLVADKPPAGGRDADGWTPWVGGTWRKWARGTVLGYKDFAGREAKPGTYDSLAHLHFDPPPTPGSSGGPIVDEESGAVVGVVLGTQLVNQLQGVRGWGVPAEMIFEMFSLPGLKLRSGGQ